MKRKIARLVLLSVLGFLVYAFVQGNKDYDTRLQTLKDSGILVEAKAVKQIQVLTGLHKEPLKTMYEIEYLDPVTKKFKVGYLPRCKNYSTSSDRVEMGCIIPSARLNKPLPMLYVPTSKGVYDGCNVSEINEKYWYCPNSSGGEYSIVSFDVNKF